MGQAIVVVSAVANEPPREHLDRALVVIDAVDRQALAPKPTQKSLDVARAQIIDRFELASLHNRSHLLMRASDVAGRRSFVPEVRGKVDYVLADRPLPMFLERIAQSGDTPLSLLYALVEHCQRRRSVDGQRYPLFPPVLVPKTPPPFLGLCFHALAGFRVRDHHRLFVDIRHRLESPRRSPDVDQLGSGVTSVGNRTQGKTSTFR
ncbi:MAG: hypothetical protein U0939_25880 [Pirellulales bacterium]